MKVLGIVGSARKGGNTEIMVKEALASAQEAGAQTELVSVVGKNIAGCDGCGTCRKTHKCHIHDDMDPIFEQLLAADAIVFGTPVYFGSVTSQMKAIMDRMYLFLRDRKLKGKVAAPVLAVRRVGAGGTRNLLYGFIMSQGMVPVRCAIGYGREKGEVREGVGGAHGSTALEEARTVGKDLVQMARQLSKA